MDMKSHYSPIILIFATDKSVMMMRYVTLITLLVGLCLVFPAMAQSTLTTANMLRSGDEFYMECLSYQEVGQSGSGQVWDFSSIEPEDKACKMSYSGDSIITGLENGTMYKYLLHDDTLKMISHESPLQLMNYEHPISLLRFPMVLNEELSSRFSGRGYYSDKYRTTTCGDYLVEADASGTLILTEHDTLYNVLRLHSVRTASLTMTCDTASEKDDIRQEIEERYTWFAPGYRYPVFVSLNRVNYYSMQPVSDFQASYRYLPEQQRMLPDSVNEEIARKHEQPQSPLTNHKVTVTGHTINVYYELNGAAHVTMLVADIMGILHKRQERYCDSAGEYYTTLDCTGLRRGDYILYINVNGQVKSNIVTF